MIVWAPPPADQFKKNPSLRNVPQTGVAADAATPAAREEPGQARHVLWRRHGRIKDVDADAAS
jgi:hypothetical protein